MVRKDASVEHVWIAEHHVRPATNGTSRILRRIAVVGEHHDSSIVRVSQPISKPVQFGQLILSQRLGWKQVEHQGMLDGERMLV
jgi:hypothetical protein